MRQSHNFDIYARVCLVVPKAQVAGRAKPTRISHAIGRAEREEAWFYGRRMKVDQRVIGDRGNQNHAWPSIAVTRVSRRVVRIVVGRVRNH
jgi:hypothetical protein